MPAPAWIRFDRDHAPSASQARSLLSITGEDAHRFLQGLWTQDVDACGGGKAVPAALTNVKGRLVSDAVLCEDDGEGFLLAVPSSLAASIREELERHVVMDDVTIGLREDWGVALIFEGAHDAEHGAMNGNASATGPRIARNASYPAIGRLWIGPAGDLMRGLDPSAEISAEHWARLRVREGIPAWGHELTAGRFPAECGFHRAVALDKGCFRGQEPLARIHARSQVKRVLARLGADTLDLPSDLRREPNGAEDGGDGESHARVVVFGDHGEPVGHVTTSAPDPEQAAPWMGLGVLLRAATSGTAIYVEGQVGRVPLGVLLAPIDDDPGVG